MDILFNGVGWTDIALTLNRGAVGIFFLLSGYHKLFNAQRHVWATPEAPLAKRTNHLRDHIEAVSALGAFASDEERWQLGDVARCASSFIEP